MWVKVTLHVIGDLPSAISSKHGTSMCIVCGVMRAVLSYRGPGGGERSVRCPMPQPRDSRSGPAPAALAAAGMAMLR